MLVVLTAWRVLAYPQRVLEDLHVPARAFGFFTGVAGTTWSRCVSARWGRPFP